MLRNRINYDKEYYEAHREKILQRKRDRRKLYPEKEILKDIKKRCNNKNRKDYKYYGGKGIKCLITKEELKKLWFRDKAYLMKKPSIDRKDSNGNYEYSNCRFIEMTENIRRMSNERWKREKLIKKGE